MTKEMRINIITQLAKVRGIYQGKKSIFDYELKVINEEIGRKSVRNDTKY